jgi:hypothetical protein
MSIHSDLRLVASREFGFYCFPKQIGTIMGGGQAVGELENADVLVITDKGPFDELPLPFPLAPVISVCGSGEPWYDHISDLRGATEGFTTAREIISRMAHLHASVVSSKSQDILLMARLYTRNTMLAARYAPNTTAAIDYPMAHGFTTPVALADRLVDRAQLTKRFFDRLHVCPNCSSSRLNVREECVSCRNPHIVEEPIIHHYKCSHQARESAFRALSHFQCPKCGEALRHIGLDYDKPGILICCNSCHSMSDASDVGFRCMDCQGTYDSNAVPTRDWFSYELSARGAHVLLHGNDLGQQCELPENFRTLLRQAMREASAFQRPYVLLRLSFAKKKFANDALLWWRLKKLALDCIHSALREVDAVCEVGDDFMVLLPNMRERDIVTPVSHIEIRMREVLKHDLRPAVKVIGRNEQTSLLAGVA